MVVKLTELWSDRLIRLVGAIGTAILALNVLAGWMAGAFDNASWSPTLVAVLAVAISTVISTGCAAAAVYQWRKRKASDQFIIDLSKMLPEEHPLGSPLEPDIDNFAQPPIAPSRLPVIYAEAKSVADQTYHDAALFAVAILASLGKPPTVRIEFEFYSTHASKALVIHWNNYDGLCEGHPGRKPTETGSGGTVRLMDTPPWETRQDWATGYRLAYEKAQPVSPDTTVITTAKPEYDGGLWHYGFGSRTYALDAADPTTVRPGPSVYSLRLNVIETFTQHQHVSNRCTAKR